MVKRELEEFGMPFFLNNSTPLHRARLAICADRAREPLCDLNILTAPFHAHKAVGVLVAEKHLLLEF